MTAKEERDYIEGQKELAYRIAASVLRDAGLERTSDEANIRLRRELRSARKDLEDIFKAKGWEWMGDTVHLGDVTNRLRKQMGID